MRQVASIDVLRCLVQVRDRSRNGPRQPDADNKRDQLDDPECDCYRSERNQDCGSYSAEISEDAVIEGRWTSVYLNQRRSIAAGRPLARWNNRAKVKLWIKSVLGRRDGTRAYCWDGLEVLVSIGCLVAERNRDLASRLALHRLQSVQSNLSQIRNSPEKQFFVNGRHHYYLQGPDGCLMFP